MHLKEEASKIRAHEVDFVSSFLVLSFPHFFLFLCILHQTHSKLKHLNPKPNSNFPGNIEKKKNCRFYEQDERNTVKERPCSQCRYRKLEPRIEKIVAMDGSYPRSSPESLWNRTHAFFSKFWNSNRNVKAFRKKRWRWRWDCGCERTVKSVSFDQILSNIRWIGKIQYNLRSLTTLFWNLERFLKMGKIQKEISTFHFGKLNLQLF